MFFFSEMIIGFSHLLGTMGSRKDHLKIERKGKQRKISSRFKDLFCFLTCIYGLDQRSTKYGLWVKSSPLLVFVWSMRNNVF